MKSSTSALTEITKIGNYAIPVFGGVVTVAIALGPIGKDTSKGFKIIVSFGIYTLLASFVSYWHRLWYLRHRRAKKNKGEEPSNLPFSRVLFIMILHLILIITLLYYLKIQGVL